MKRSVRVNLLVLFCISLLATIDMSCSSNEDPEPSVCSETVSYSDDIVPLLEANCIKSGCHDGLSGPPNWGVYSNVKEKAAKIKEFTQDGTMPADGTLTQQEIDLIACWVDNGALNN